MKIAMPTRGGEIDAHFGHCEYFTVFTVDGGAIVAEERVDSPAGCGCKSNVASILAGKGVSLMVAGNMGDGAVRVLKREGVEVIRGCAGSVRDRAEDWAAGRLRDSGEGCAAHDHGHDCGGH